jgi:hypothetical protein
MKNILTHQETQPQAAAGYVDLPKLLETLFPLPECRPSIRWGRDHQHEWPNVRIGRLIYFDPPMVKAHLDAKNKSRSK